MPKKVKKAILGEHATPSKAAKLQALWQRLHARYGHASMKRIRLPDVLQNATKHIDFSCPTCSAAKACRRPHSGKLKRATYAMKRVHTDLQGPFCVPDLDGHRYAAVFVDCYTRRKWLYLLKDKAAYGATMLRWLASVGTAPDQAQQNAEQLCDEIGRNTRGSQQVGPPSCGRLVRKPTSHTNLTATAAAMHIRPGHRQPAVSATARHPAVAGYQQACRNKSAQHVVQAVNSRALQLR